MRIIFPIIFMITFGLAGCQTIRAQQAAKLPVCDGKHRRSANPYGSVLLPTAGPSAPAPTVAAAPVGEGCP